jgi:hypothetical protein
MNAEQVNAVGGWCELVGVAFLVRDLMSLARFREKPKEWAARFRSGWAATIAWARRMLRLPEQKVLRDAGAAADMMLTGRASAVVIPEPYRPRPDLSLQEQIEELGRLLNKTGEAIGQEQHEREQAIATEREARHQEVQAEAEAREQRIAEVLREVERLREVTTGDLGLRAESVVFLTLGIICTTWPELVAGWLPEWPPFRVAMTFLGGYLLFRTCWALWLRPFPRAG